MVSSMSYCKNILIIFIKFYQYFISPFLGKRCRFYPSCSHYSIGIIKNFNFLKGTWLIIKRILKCHPLCLGGYDPIPFNFLKKKF